MIAQLLNYNGWTLAYVSLSAGASYSRAVSRPTPRSNMRTVVVWVKGCITGVSDQGQQVATRLPGLRSLDLPDAQRGIYRFTAVEDSAWVCVDRALNSGQLPSTVQVVQLSPGQVTAEPLVTTTPEFTALPVGYTVVSPTIAIRIL